MTGVRNRVIVSCAVTGSVHTPTMSPYLPLTPEEIAEQSIAAAEAGAAVLQAAGHVDAGTYRHCVSGRQRHGRALAGIVDIRVGRRRGPGGMLGREDVGAVGQDLFLRGNAFEDKGQERVPDGQERHTEDRADDVQQPVELIAAVPESRA